MLRLILTFFLLAIGEHNSIKVGAANQETMLRGERALRKAAPTPSPTKAKTKTPAPIPTKAKSKKPPITAQEILECAKRCSKTCLVAGTPLGVVPPKAATCAKKYVEKTAACKRSATAEKKCLAFLGCSSGTRCSDGSCVALGTCCPGMHHCSDGITCGPFGTCCDESDRIDPCSDGTCVGKNSCCLDVEKQCPNGRCRLIGDSCDLGCNGQQPCANNEFCMPDGDCVCADNYMRDSNGICTAMTDTELVIMEALLAANTDEAVALFPKDVIEQIATDLPMVPGQISFSSNARTDNNFPLFTIEEGSLSNQLIVSGTYSTLPGATIQEDLQARLYFVDGLRASGAVDASSGFFSLAVYDVPYGVSPFILVFVSESYTGGEGRALEPAASAISPQQTPLVCMCGNAEPCGPAFSVTLTWDQPTSDVDLYVTEPATGETVYFGNKIGFEGAYLDLDDTEGYGPEHYYAPTVVTVGQNYLIQVKMWSYHDDLTMDVNWNLWAHSYGKLLWSRSGKFRYGITSSESDVIPFTFDATPSCEVSVCNTCFKIPEELESPSDRRLPMIEPPSHECRVPWTWQPLGETKAAAMKFFYCEFYKPNVNLLFLDGLLNKASACRTEPLTEEEKNRIVASITNNGDFETALAAARAVKRLQDEKSEKIECRNYNMALEIVLEALEISASVQSAGRWGVPGQSYYAHYWVEAEIKGDDYILDCFQDIYVKIASAWW